MKGDPTTSIRDISKTPFKSECVIKRASLGLEIDGQQIFVRYIHFRLINAYYEHCLSWDTGRKYTVLLEG